MGDKITVYQALGGEERLRELVDVFYRIMDEAEEAAAIRSLHPKSLRVSADKLFMFLSGVFGGPDLYREKYGHPRLRARHLPFPIGEKERDEWLWCMGQAMAEIGMEEPLNSTMWEYFTSTANHMMNRSENKDPFNIVG